MVEKSVYDNLYDRRTVSRCMSRSLLSNEDYEKFLSTLPDESDEGEPVVIEEESAEETSTDSEE
ncbi:hypothetical protein ACFLRA_03490 [Bdellovibrionota bacterium]